MVRHIGLLDLRGKEISSPIIHHSSSIQSQFTTTVLFMLLTLTLTCQPYGCVCVCACVRVCVLAGELKLEFADRCPPEQVCSTGEFAKNPFYDAALTQILNSFRLDLTSK